MPMTRRKPESGRGRGVRTGMIGDRRDKVEVEGVGGAMGERQEWEEFSAVPVRARGSQLNNMREKEGGSTT